MRSTRPATPPGSLGRRRRPHRAGFAAAAALLLGACSANPGLGPPATAALPGKPGAAAPVRTEPTAPVKAALLLPLSGPGQTPLLADAMKRAAELAASDPSAAHVQLIIHDDKGTREGAAAAAEAALADGAEILLGPLLAPAVGGAETVARARNVPIVAFSTDRTVAGRNVHLLSFLAGPEVHRVVAHAAGQGRTRIAALLPADAYGRILEASLREAAARSGATVVAVETFGGEAANAMLQAVRRLREQVRGIEEHGDPIDALFVPGGEETLPILAPQLRQADFDPGRIKILGTGALDYANAGRDPMLVGAWFAAPDPRGFKDFATRFARAHGQAPPRIASLAYDAVGVAAALSAGPLGARFIPASLTRPGGFTGVDGAFRFQQDGTADRALAVLEVQAFGAAVVDPAPASFESRPLAVPRPAPPPGAARASVGASNARGPGP
jgi:ABC-type branched-subunit amino acid transport system substrate-binding protein